MNTAAPYILSPLFNSNVELLIFKTYLEFGSINQPIPVPPAIFVTLRSLILLILLLLKIQFDLD